MSATLDGLAAGLVAYLETGTPAPGLFADDVFCDFTLPRWRLQARGIDDVLALRRRGHPAPGRVPRWRADPTPDGYVLEVEETWSDERSDWYCRELLRVRLRGDTIARLSVYCTGDWDAARCAEHRAAVTLLEP